MKKDIRGFTLVELLIVMTIVAILAMAMTGNLDPIALINRGGDVRRKKDIRRIKIAMEEYMGDKGVLPNRDLVDQLNDEGTCGSDVFSPWLPNWPCDPSGGTYKVAIDNEEDPPAWFKVLTKLRNDNDNDIPEWWGNYEPETYVVRGGYSNTEINFGVSSSNIVWYDRAGLEDCILVGLGQCYERQPGDENSCQGANGGLWCDGDNCFLNTDCTDECRASHCKSSGTEVVEYW